MPAHATIGKERDEDMDGATSEGQDEGKRWISIEKTRDVLAGRRQHEGLPLMVEMCAGDRGADERREVRGRRWGELGKLNLGEVVVG